ncbi:hypothetical protein [Streptomyces noursei]|uniref:hypothetical protein n=1 Tax=Streptomyces noursei TaxID=1971 RepID=UPI001676D18E|nr:hypothetical protein [Streptomyces noursei]MCZ1014477.1 hypothetical protein [Streptomyces noursei]GGW95337.1 hypothetical protein GCM10010341_15670 [Streptomyces noursei]
MEWLVSMAPVLGPPLFGMVGALGGAWLVYRQGRRKDQAEASINSVRTVTDGFATLLDQQRCAHDRTLERVATLEARQMDLERRVEHLQEEQRQWRRWKAAAIEYIHDLRDLVRDVLHRSTPTPPDEIAEDIAQRESA